MNVIEAKKGKGKQSIDAAMRGVPLPYHTIGPDTLDGPRPCSRRSGKGLSGHLLGFSGRCAEAKKKKGDFSKQTQDIHAVEKEERTTGEADAALIVGSRLQFRLRRSGSCRGVRGRGRRRDRGGGLLLLLHPLAAKLVVPVLRSESVFVEVLRGVRIPNGHPLSCV